MSEKELDSSVNEYEEEYKSSNYVKQLQWDMAIGLQKVDNLKPSKHLEKLLKKNVEGNLTIEEVEKELKEYYVEKENCSYLEYRLPNSQQKELKLLESKGFKTYSVELCKKI